MPRRLHRAIKVASVTITTVTATCERCGAKASGQCTYPNHEIFVSRELKYITINTNRSTRSQYPVHKLVCMDCARELEAFFEAAGPHLQEQRALVALEAAVAQP